MRIKSPVKLRRSGAEKFLHASVAFIFLILVSCQDANSQAANKTKSGALPPAPAPVSIADIQKSLYDISRNVAPSVVYIGVEQTVSRTQVDPFEFFFGSPDEQSPRSRSFTRQGLGSGVIYAKKGKEYFIVTNNHVIESADKISVVVGETKNYKARLVGSDPYVDIAIIKIETDDDLTIARFGDSDTLQAGAFVAAVGNPYGLSGTMTFGIISAMGRSDIQTGDRPALTDFIQTDASINPGNSGGALIDLQGQVIGINTMIYSQSGGNVGIGFAIPSNVARRVADELISGKKEIDHGYLGIQFSGINQESAEQLGLDANTTGMLVSSVVSGGPADKAGIKAGDIIVELDGKKINRSGDLTVKVANSAPGSNISMTVLRDGKSLMKTVTLGNRSALAKGEGQPLPDGAATALREYGYTVSELTDDVKKQYNIPAELRGVLIASVEQRGAAARAGLQPGDVIYRINNRRITKTSELVTIVEKSQRRNYYFVFRGGSEYVVMM